MGQSMNHQGVAHVHHHHHGVEYIVAGVGILLLFLAFAVLQSIISGHVFGPMYIGVVFGVYALAIGTTFWARH